MRKETTDAVKDLEIASQEHEQKRKTAIRELKQEQRVISRKIRKLARMKK